MEKIKRTLFSPRDSLSNNWAVVNMTVIIIMMTVCAFFSLAVPKYYSSFFTGYGYAAIAIMLTLYLYNQRLSGAVEIKIMALYVAWLIFTRWLSRDFLLKDDLGLVYAIVFSFLIFGASIVLSREQRLKAFDWVSALLGLYSFVMALVGLFIILTGCTIVVPPERQYLALNLSGVVYTTTFFNSHRNYSSVWFYVGLTLMMYQFFACKRKAWRIPITIAAVIDFVAIAYSHSRTVQVVTAFSIGLVLFLIVKKCLKPEAKKYILALLLAVIVPVATVFFYKVADWTTDGITKISTITTPAFTEFYLNLDKQLNPSYFAPESWGDSSTEEEADEGEADTEDSSSKSFSDTRDFVNDLSTLTGRKAIWKTVIPVAKNRPMIMLKGTLNKLVTEEPAKYCSIAAIGMHNFLLQVLMLTGIPGFLLVAAQCLILAVHMLRLFFAKESEADISIKILTIPIFGLLIRGMMEVGMFTSTGHDSQAFFLIAGMAMAMYYDVFPAKHRS